ncbi:MAG TPA: hypothetical protein VFP13_04255 [Actinomycetota bacterium]|nr:hypothetical protein [Actinomycetota bacterium]
MRFRQVAEGLSVAIVILMVGASAAGLVVDDLYPDGPWAREALRGGDLTTLLLAAPILLLSLFFVRRGSRRAQVVWLGTLAYSVYNYAYYAFGARFNDVFLIHIALLALAIWATTFAVAGIDVAIVVRSLNRGRSGRWAGAFLALVGTILGGLWIALSIRFAFTGGPMADIPIRGIHLVFAIDLALLVPALVVAGVLCWRRSRSGILFAGVMTVMGALYQVNLLLAGVLQADAGVPGVKAFPPEGVVLAIGFGATAAVVFRRRSTG